jgi:hypothetical protein
VIKLTKIVGMGGGPIFLHLDHIIQVEPSGAGSEITLSTDKKVSVEEAPELIALKVGNMGYFFPYVSTQIRDYLQEVGYGLP